MNKAVIIIAILAILMVIAVVFYLVFYAMANKPLRSTEIMGMKVEVWQEGSGPEAKAGDNILAHYAGTLEDGKEFDSSYKKGVPLPLKIGVGEVIKGWDLGVVGMKAGEKRRLVIPPQLAYGQAGIPGFIPQNATLIFDIELIKIN